MDPSGFHSYIFPLNSNKDFEFLISSSTSNMFWDLKGNRFSIFEVLSSGPLRKLYGFSELGNTLFIKLGKGYSLL